MIAWILAAHAGPHRLVPEMFTSTVDTPFGATPKSNLYHLCFAPMVRIGTVTTAESFVKDLFQPDGRRAGREVYTTLTLATDGTLRGTEAAAFDLLVEGGTHDGTFYPHPAGTPRATIGARYLVGYRTVIPPEHQMPPHTWPADTPVLLGFVSFAGPLPLDLDGLGAQLAATCEATDFTTP